LEISPGTSAYSRLKPRLMPMKKKMDQQRKARHEIVSA